MSKKIESYKIKMVQFIKKSFPDLSLDFIETKIDEIINERNHQDEDLTIDIKFFDQKSNDVTNVNINKLETFLDKKNHILTKYGTAYCQHDKLLALEGEMLDYSGKKRKEAKDKMFEHINDENPVLMKRYDAQQQTYKASIMNSYYGVLTTKGSIFRDMDAGESVTAVGEETIMTAMDTFERFLTNNIHFYDENDVINYILNIINEEYETEIDIEIDDKDELVKYLNNYFYNRDTLEKINVDLSKNEAFMNLLNTLTNEEITKIYYKNNFIEFLNDMEFYNDIAEILKDNENPFLNPNKPNDKHKKILEHIWKYVKDWVFYNYIDYNKYNFCKKGLRHLVPTVDTDSNFLCLYKTFLFFEEKLPDIVSQENDTSIVCTINCITYLITNAINIAFLKYTRRHNIIDDNFGKLINMKNEIMIYKMLLTKNKKSYAIAVLMKEGNLLTNKKVTIKGIQIKKSNTNKIVGDYFINTLNNDIILSKDINLSLIINKYFNLMDIIKQSLNKGEMKFSLPLRANEMEGYVNPYDVMQVRGVAIFNILFPENEIKLPTNVNIIKIILENDLDLIKNKIIDYCKNNSLTYTNDELETFLSRVEEAFNFEIQTTIEENNKTKVITTKPLLKNDIIDIISLPKSINEIPIFIRPFINLDTMVLNHLNTGNIILDSLGIQTPKINDNLVPTNIIKF